MKRLTFATKFTQQYKLNSKKLENNINMYTQLVMAEIRKLLKEKYDRNLKGFNAVTTINGRFVSTLGQITMPNVDSGNIYHIQISKRFIEDTPDIANVVDTIAHEVIHGLVHSNFGKGYDDGDTLFESYLKAVGVSSTRSKQGTGNHKWKCEEGSCTFVRKRNMSKFFSKRVCATHQKKLNYIGYFKPTE